MISENYDVFLKDFSVTATVGDRSFLCIFDRYADELSEVSAEGRRIEATVKSSDATDLNREDEILINGTTYAIAQILPVEDGKFTDLILIEP